MKREESNSWRDVWRRFRRSTIAMIALVYVTFVAIVALFAPMIASSKPLILRTPAGIQFPSAHDLLGTKEGIEQLAQGRVVIGAPVPHSPVVVDFAHRLDAPTPLHHFGTDDVGRDVLARLVHGARVSLTVAILAAAIALIVGSFFGAIAGFYGGWIDWIVSRLIEMVLCFPFLFLVLAIVALFGPSMYTIIIALGATTWTNEARYVRGEIMRIRELEFAHAARASGASDVRIIFRHLLPNALAPALVSTNFAVAAAVLTESSLSFLGLGVPLPAPTWGGMLSLAEMYIDSAWWLVLYPGIAIFATVAAFNVVGDRFREALDPRG
ncbi:MAG TPA: ABC transporter permease [Thermoanaerobaculia bacterium]|nr:ABC transporter permease [Thermoanaerobaculia bacterium]